MHHLREWNRVLVYFAIGLWLAAAVLVFLFGG